MAGQLVVIRHAKAGEAPRDVERQLTDRGRRDAAAIGNWLKEQGVVPDRVVVSPAERAMQTWSGASEQLERAPDPLVDERIYDNTVDLLLDIVSETPDDVRSLDEPRTRMLRTPRGPAPSRTCPRLPLLLLTCRRVVGRCRCCLVLEGAPPGWLSSPPSEAPANAPPRRRSAVCSTPPPPGTSPCARTAGRRR